MNKIKDRIKIAEEMATKDILNGVDLKTILKKLIVEENYCGAEGIKRAMKKLKKLKKLKE